MMRLIYRLITFGALWLVLCGGDPRSWGLAGPTILAAALLSLSLAPAKGTQLRWSALPGFCLFLLIEMVRGALQTARLAVGPVHRLQPGLVTLPLQLRQERARTLLVNTLNLVPGTLSVALEDGTLVLHTLTASPTIDHDCRRLERRIARLFAEEER